MAASHPFTFPQAGAIAPAAAPRTAGVPSASPATAAPPAVHDDFFSGVGSQGAGAQRLPDATPGNYPLLRIDEMKRIRRWDGVKMVITDFTVMAPAQKTDPLFDPLLEGARFSVYFTVEKSPAFASWANLVGAAFNGPASSVTVSTMQQLLPELTAKGAPAAPCVLNGAGVMVKGLFFKRGDSQFCSVNWGAVPGRSYPDVVAASASQG